MDPAQELEGEPMTPAIDPISTTSSPIHGSRISLIPLSNTHIKPLYPSIAGSQNSDIWTYVPSGPYLDEGSFSGFIKEILNPPDVMFTIIPSSPLTTPDKKDDIQALGICGFSNIAPKHRSIEMGMILSPALQRTTAGTECSYLLLKHCFDDLGYLRVEWKCDGANKKSKRAAERLGFVWEGCLRRHQIVRGRRRDTALFSIIKEEWDVVRKSLELWLEEGNFLDGAQVRKLEEIRGDLRKGKT